MIKNIAPLAVLALIVASLAGCDRLLDPYNRIHGHGGDSTGTGGHDTVIVHPGPGDSTGGNGGPRDTTGGHGPRDTTIIHGGDSTGGNGGPRDTTGSHGGGPRDTIVVNPNPNDSLKGHNPNDSLRGGRRR